MGLVKIFQMEIHLDDLIFYIPYHTSRQVPFICFNFIILN